MNYFSFYVLVFLLFRAYCTAKNDSNSSSFILPAPDRYFHIYSLPVGQGDSIVMQCPSPGGELTLLDMGSSDGSNGGKVWGSGEIKNFLRDSFDRIRNIIITHNHNDHYNLLDKVLKKESFTRNLKNFYISCRPGHLPSRIQKWIEKFNLSSKLRMFNGGDQCGSNNITCGNIDVCPGSRIEISAKVLMANWGQQCGEDSEGGSNGEPTTPAPSNLNKNIDSPIISLKINKVKVLLNGDFEDFTANEKEKGPTDSLVRYYRHHLKSDIYYVSHHGAVNLANKDMILKAVKPKAIVMSSNPFSRYHHPRCLVIDRLLNTHNTICKPFALPDSDSYCGPHPLDAEPGQSNRSEGGKKLTKKQIIAMRLQRTYTCGEEKDADNRNVTNNGYAIYTTVPDLKKMNLVELRSDGDLWGFVNHYIKKKK